MHDFIINVNILFSQSSIIHHYMHSKYVLFLVRFAFLHCTIAIQSDLLYFLSKWFIERNKEVRLKQKLIGSFTSYQEVPQI